MKTIKILLLCFFVMNTAIGDTAFGHGIDLGRVQDKLAPSSVFDDGLQGIQHKDIGRLTASLEYSLLSLPCDIESVNFVSLVKQLNEYRPSIFDKTHFFFREAKIIPGTDSVVIRGKIKDEKDQNDEDLVRTYYMVFHSKKDENNGFSIEVYTDKEWKKSEKFVKDGILPVRELSKPQDAFTIRRYVTDNEGVSGVDGHIRKRISEGAFTKIAGRTRDIGWDEKYPYREKPRSYWSEELLEMIKGEKDLPDGKNTRLDVFLERFGTSVEKAFTDKNIVFLKNNSDKSSILGSFLENTGIVRSVKVKGHASKNAVYVFLSEKDFNTLSLMFKAERKGRKPGKKRVSRMVKEITDVLVHEIGVVYGLNFGFHENTGRILNSMDHMWEEFRITNEKGEAFDAEYITGLAEKYPLTEDIFDIEGTIDLDRDLVKRGYFAGEAKDNDPNKITEADILNMTEKMLKIFKEKGYVSAERNSLAVTAEDFVFEGRKRSSISYVCEYGSERTRVAGRAFDPVKDIMIPVIETYGTNEAVGFKILIDGEIWNIINVVSPHFNPLISRLESLIDDVKKRKPGTREEAVKQFAKYFGPGGLNIADVCAWLASLGLTPSEYLENVLHRFSGNEKGDLAETIQRVNDLIIADHIYDLLREYGISQYDDKERHAAELNKIWSDIMQKLNEKSEKLNKKDLKVKHGPTQISKERDIVNAMIESTRSGEVQNKYELMAGIAVLYVIDHAAEKGISENKIISDKNIKVLCEYILDLYDNPDMSPDIFLKNGVNALIVGDMSEKMIRTAQKNRIYIKELGAEAVALLEQLQELPPEVLDISKSGELGTNLTLRDHFAGEAGDNTSDVITLNDVLSLSKSIQKVFRERGYFGRFREHLKRIVVKDILFSDGKKHEVVYFYVGSEEQEDIGAFVDGEKMNPISEALLPGLKTLISDIENRKPRTQEEAKKMFAAYVDFRTLNIANVEAWLESLDQPASEYINGV
ncbi:MAG: hypothetical protein KKG84_05655, partial [Candidatus Omnitrophica bacterium]|nr:hypothetical protein [Candidatus Omnitrophota bacterium]